MSKRQQRLEVVCPKCKKTRIISVPKEELPKCEDCNRRMVIRELLKEGKSL